MKSHLRTVAATLFLAPSVILYAGANKPGMGDPETISAQHEKIRKSKKIVLIYGPLHYGRRNDAAMNKWRENRFGQFIHFGLYSIPGGVWKGKTYNYASEFLRYMAAVPKAEWAALGNQFSLDEFDPKAWAAMAKEMGARYVVITTKHHDGFCLWPSQYTGFDIENTAYKKDFLKAFTDAYNAEGIDVYFYYSILDWYHPDYRSDIKSKTDEEAFNRYKQYVRNQLVELLERYPTVKGLWFDGTWEKSWRKNGKFSYDLEVLLKKVRPGLIVNSRLRADDFGRRHFDSNHDLMGDYESGYERRLPDARDTSVTKRDWECCMTIPENQWGYHKDWSLSHVKSSCELIEMLVHAVSLNGNFLLNFGPKGDGGFREEEKKRAAEIGAWMRLNGEAIYGCGYAGFRKQDWGYFTKNTANGTVYMVVCNVPVSGLLKIKLPRGEKVTAATLLENDRSLRIEKYDSDESLVVLENKNHDWPFVIRLAIEDPSAPVRAKAKQAAAAAGKTVAAGSLETQKNSAPEQTFDGNPSTCWSTNEKNPWILYTLKTNTRIDRIGINWYAGSRRAYPFEIEVSLDGKTWKTVYRGTNFQSGGMEYYTFEPVTARYICIQCHGNDKTGFSAIREVDIRGLK